MKKILLTTALTLLTLTGPAQAQESKKATELPDISVIGNFIGTHSESKKGFDVSEIELSFQHYLYPSVKANVITALHKEEDGSRAFEMEEAYVSFSDLLGVLFPNNALNIGLGAVVGKKLLGVGKLNGQHPETWHFVDRPLVSKTFLGDHESISAEGVQLNYLLPLPFFSQVELGYWAANKTEEEEAEGAHTGIEYENDLITSRLWNGFSLSDTQELELGVSYLQGNGSKDDDQDKKDVMGVDISYTHELSNHKSLKILSEVFQAKYGEEGEASEEQRGAFVSTLFKFSPTLQSGIRFGTLGKHGDEGETKNQWAFAITRNLTETSKFRLQYNTGDSIDNTLYAQFLFGFGPHAHVLQ